MIGDFVDGPLWYFSLFVFVVGVLWRLAGLWRLGSRPEYSAPRGSAAGGGLKTLVRHFFPRSEVVGRTRTQVFGGYAFHLGLLVLLFWGAPHVAFYEERLLGFGWTPLPDWAFIVACEIAFAGLLVVWLHRVLHPVTRALSDRGDHAASILVFLVMLSGCLALARSHEPLRILHLFLVEALLIYFPFSMLMHTFTFAVSRWRMGAHYGRRGVSI